MIKLYRINAVIIVALAIAFILCAYSGLVLFFALQPSADFISHLGVSRFIWLKIHVWSGLATVILVFFHVIFHFNYVKNMSKMFRGRGQ